MMLYAIREETLLKKNMTLISYEIKKNKVKVNKKVLI